MTRKDYIAFARILREIKPRKDNSADDYGAKLSQWGKMIEAIAGVFEDGNERFDREKFFKACGYLD